MATPTPPPGLPFETASWDQLRRPIWLFDPVSCRGLYANASALLLWDADTLAELLARDFSKLSAAVRTRVERLAAATAHGEAVSERWSFYPKGRPVTVQAMISSLSLGGGRTALLFEASPADVEEDELRGVEALRHTSSLISLFDGDGRSTFGNPAAFAAYGDDGRTFVDRFSDLAHGAGALNAVLAGEVLSELRQVNTNSGARWHYLDARQVLDPVTGKVCVLLSERDVTAQVDAEHALEAAEERAEVAEAKRRFLANMSHELRTPLNSVLGYASLLSQSALDAAQTDQVARVGEAGRTLLGIIDDVIDLAEIDGGEVVLRAAPFTLEDLAESAFGKHLDAAEAKGLAVSVAATDVPTAFVGDVARLAKALGHYAANAVKFTLQGEIGVRFDGAWTEDGRFLLEASVIDTGPGLDAAAQARLFRRFSPGDDGACKSLGGSGLGLAVVRELTMLMGGEAGVDSRPGEGSRFWLRIPLAAREDGADTRDGDRDGVEATGPGRALDILYADDNENNRVLVRTMLASQGHRCNTVNDGAEAVRAALDGVYDLVLMDIQMPVQDGVSAAIAIRAGHGPLADRPILALTANTLSDQLAAYEAAGMNDCIGKPVTMNELLAKVAYWGDPDAIRKGAERSASAAA